MKTYKLLFTLFLILFALKEGVAQRMDFANGNKEYNLSRYKTAIPYYLKGLKTDSVNLEATEHLANAYRNIKDYKNAEIWYSKAVSLRPDNPANNLYYAEILANNSKYDASKISYKKYLALNSSDFRADLFVKAYEDVSKFYSDSSQWQVRFTSLNTNFDEFSPVFLNRGLVITSNRSTGVTKHLSGSDLKPFTDLYYISDTSNISPIDLKELKMTPMMAGNDIGISDNRALGNFNIKPLSRINEYSYEEGYVPAVLLKGALNSKFNDGPVSFPEDESWIMFTRNNNNKLQLFSARYINGKWDKIESFAYNSNEFSTSHPALSRDGNTLYFASNMPGGYGGVDLYYCLRKGFSWSKPVNLGRKINTEGDEMFPSVDSDGNLYFSSTGLAGLGGLDIFYVPLKDNMPLKDPLNLGYPVNSSKDDFGLITRPGGSASGYFSSNRLGSDDIYRFDRIPAKLYEETLAGDENKPFTDAAPSSSVTVDKAPAEIPAIAQTPPERIIPQENIAASGQAQVQAPVITQVPKISDAINGVGQTAIETGSNIKNVIPPSFSQRGFAAVASDQNINNTVLVMHRTAPAGSMIKITNPLNGKSISAKVFGKFTENASTKDVLIVVSKVTADRIGVLNKKFFEVIIEYDASGKAPVKEESLALAAKPVKPVEDPDRSVSKEEVKTVQEPTRSAPAPIKALQEPAKSVSQPVRSEPKIVRSMPEQVKSVSAAANSIILPENTSIAATINAVDADAGTVFTYSLSGGSDVSKFRINNSTGVLTFISPPDFERPTDADANNNYVVKIRVSDGTNASEQTITIVITDINDNSPIVVSNSDFSIQENTIAVTNIKATDNDAGTIFGYSLNGGADAEKFRINSNTGALTFILSPDFENPLDFDTNNVYVVGVRVSDGANNTDQTIKVTIVNTNDNSPVINPNTAFSISENSNFVTTIGASDADAGTIFNYGLNGGPDASKFRINSSSGALSFISPPDFENSTDADVNNAYIVVVKVSDGKNTVEQTITVTVTDINDNNPIITSAASFLVSENGTQVTSITAIDADGSTVLNYSLSNGADVSKFRINSNTGALIFISSPDFEKPADADANNIYVVGIKVSDGKNIAEHLIKVTVKDINDNSPVITSATDFSIPENSVAVTIIKATDADAGTAFTYSLSGGPDVNKFRVNSSTGTLTFISPPDFENPADADANNTYVVVVNVSDGTSATDHTITVTVTNINDNAPVIKFN